MADFTQFNTGDIFGEPQWESRESRPTSSRMDRSVKRMKPNKVVNVRFITNPTKYEFDPSLCLFYTADGSWTKYREAQAFQGLMDGRELTHKQVPVADYKITPSGERTSYGVTDVLQAQLVPSDEEKKKDHPPAYAQAKDILLVSVVFEDGSFSKDTKYDPAPGEVILLAFNTTQRKFLENEYKTAMKYSPDFDFTKGVWRMYWHNPTGVPTGWTLDLQQVTEGIPPLTSIPDVLDGAATVRAIRAACEAEVFNTAPAQVVEEFADQSEENALTEEFEQIITTQTPAPAASTGDGDFSGRSPAWVKGMLRKAGVEVPSRITNEDLYALAAQHLSADAA